MFFTLAHIPDDEGFEPTPLADPGEADRAKLEARVSDLRGMTQDDQDEQIGEAVWLVVENRRGSDVGADDLSSALLTLYAVFGLAGHDVFGPGEASVVVDYDEAEGSEDPPEGYGEPGEDRSVEVERSYVAMFSAGTSLIREVSMTETEVHAV